MSRVHRVMLYCCAAGLPKGSSNLPSELKEMLIPPTYTMGASSPDVARPLTATTGILVQTIHVTPPWGA